MAAAADGPAIRTLIGAGSTSPYSALTLAEAQAGSATTVRGVNASLLKQIMYDKITGSSVTAPTAIGQGVMAAADAAAARALLGITGSDPNLVNVKTAFGAVGNGTTDDSAAIINAAASITAGKVLYFPPGNYRFAQQNPTLGAAIVLSGVSNCGILFDPSARLVMDNLSGGTGTSHGILIKGSASNCLL